MSNEEGLRRSGTKWASLMIVSLRQLEFLGHIMRKNWSEELILTGSVDRRRCGEDREKYLTNLSRKVTEQLPRRGKDKVKEINLLRAAKDRSMWKPMIPHTLNGHGTYREREKYAVFRVPCVLT